MAKILISNRLDLIWPDVKKILIGAAMAAIGAIVTYVAEHINGVNFGEFTPFVVMIVSILANTIRKWIAETKY